MGYVSINKEIGNQTNENEMKKKENEKKNHLDLDDMKIDHWKLSDFWETPSVANHNQKVDNSTRNHVTHTLNIKGKNY